MQIKASKKSSSNKELKPVITTPDGRKLIMTFDTKDLIKDKGLNYFSLYKGSLAYFFDAPASRIHDTVQVICEKEVYYLSMVPLILNLIFWRANVLFGMKITKKEMSVEERTISIKNILKKKKKVNFLELFDVLNKEYVVVTFLAILEMARRNELKISQEYEYGDIICEVQNGK